MRNTLSLLFVAGLAFLLFVIAGQLDFGLAPMLVGSAINQAAPGQVGAANLVTSVVLGYRAIDTLGELAILFTAATAGGLVLGRPRAAARKDSEAGFILRTASDLLFPLLLVVGLFIVVHGHLTPGGGFQGGVILAAAFFVPLEYIWQNISSFGVSSFTFAFGIISQSRSRFACSQNPNRRRRYNGNLRIHDSIY